MEYSLLVIVLAAIFTAVRWLFWSDYNVKHADHQMFLTHTPEGFPIGSECCGQHEKGVKNGND